MRKSRRIVDGKGIGFNTIKSVLFEYNATQYSPDHDVKLLNISYYCDVIDDVFCETSFSRHGATIDCSDIMYGLNRSMERIK